MKTRSLRVLGALVVALVPAAVPHPAVATPGWLGPVPVLGHHVTTQTGAVTAVAPSGRLVMGHVTAFSDGAVEVQVRAAGRPFGSVRTLQSAASGVSPTALAVAAGPRGTLGAVWWSGSAVVASFLPAGRTQWTAPRTVRSDFVSFSQPVIDAAGRMWLAYSEPPAPGEPSTLAVRSLLPTGPISTTRLAAPLGEVFPFSQQVSLTLTPAGAVRTVAKRTRTVTDGSGPFAPCSVVTSMIAADFARTRATATGVRKLAEYTATGFDFAIGLCFETGGEITSSPMTAARSTGTTASYSLRNGTGPSTLVAFDRPVGAGWRSAGGTGATSPFSQMHLRTMGERLVSVGVDNAVVPNQVAVKLRAPGGAWGPWRRVTGDFGGFLPVAAASPRGAVFGWSEQGDDRDLQVRRMTATGTLGPIVDLAAHQNDRATGAGVDAQGNAVVGLLRYDGASYHAAARAFDAAGPLLSVMAPRTVVVGRILRLRATARDVWSPPASQPVWRIDGGSPRTGGSLMHEFRTIGRHRVVVRSVDARGTATVVVRVVTVRRP